MRMDPIHCTHRILPGLFLFVFCLRHKQKKTTVLSNWSARHSVKYCFGLTLKSLKDKRRRQQRIRGVKGRYTIYVSPYELSVSKECKDEKILHKLKKVEKKKPVISHYREVAMRTWNEAEKCKLEKLFIIEGGQRLLAIPRVLTMDSNFLTEDQKNKCCPLDKHIKDSELWPHPYLCASHFVNIHMCTLVYEFTYSSCNSIFLSVLMKGEYQSGSSLLGIPLYLDDAFS